MAKNFGARKDSKYKVVSSSPSVNKTPRGPAIVDVPYDVQQNLSKSDVVSPNVYFNAKPVYVKTSHSTKVTGDKQGSHGGVKSGTVEGQSDPIQASPSVFVNGKAVVRVGDVQHMQNKNTVGKVTSSESGSAAHITDDGKVAADAAPEPIPTPYAKNKPTNNKGSGSLGSRTGSPVLLKSGKLFYSVNDTDLIAPVPFSLRRFYLSDESNGIFGKGWQCAYENKLVRSDPQTLSFIFTDDQIFRFTYSDKGFIDEDDLGAKLTLVSAQTFLLEYFADAHTELYVNGHLNHIQDRNGNTLNIVRESNGRLIRITSSLAALSFSYNKEGFVSRVVKEVNGKARETTLGCHVGSAWDYTYDEEHRLTEVHDPLGGITRYGYGKVFLEQIIDPSGVVILNVTYDSNGRVESYREEGVRYTYAYSPNRVIKTETSGDKTFYGIDNFGAIRAITYPDATTTREEYHDDTSIIIDEGGNTHIQVFDKRHRLIREVHPDKSVILYSYKGNNPYPSIINHEDKITTHVYDERYNKLSTTYSDGTTESYSYDDRGNQITFIDRSSVSTSYGYNDLGLRIRYSDALGGITQNVYDELGNCITIIDPEERITQFEYDTLSRLISITDNAQKTIFFHYDKAGRKSALVDPLGNTTRYIYDENGFLRTEIAPDARQKHYAYDRGLLTSITREDGAKYSFSYDKKRHRLSKSIGDKTTHYTYDTLGNILTIDDGVNTVEYVYDINANVLLERLGNESVSYAYNPDGTKRFIGYADAHYRLVRDESGNLVEIRKGLESYALKYDPLGNQTSLTYPNRLSQKSQFDPLGRIAKRSWGENEPLVYTYDKSSRIVMKNTTPYRYDEAGRIASAGDEDYHYDEAGNLLRGESTIDSVSGRLISQGDTGFSYDGLGRLIEKRSPTTKTTYQYDVEGSLVSYFRHSTSPVHPEHVEGSLELRFTYDPLGRRLTKHCKEVSVIPYSDTESNSTKESEYHHRYLYAGDNIVAIYDNDTDELIATLLHDEGIDTPLSISLYDKETLSTYELDSMSEEERYLYTQSLIQTYYYHRDHQNSIIALTNKEGQIVESYSYDPYGNITHSTKTLETYNPYGYTGREIDTDDLYYYRARYYDPTIGRFITPDPIGFLGGDTNFYRYVGNDPVNFVDYSGFEAKAAGKVKNPVQKTLKKTATKNNPTAKKGKTTKGNASKAGTDGAKSKGDVKPIEPNKYLYFIFYVPTGSKNDKIFKKSAIARAKSITSGTNYRKNIDIVYLSKVTKTSEIVSFVHQKVAENGGKEKAFIKTIEVFAELKADKHGEITRTQSKATYTSTSTINTDIYRPSPVFTAPITQADINTVNDSVLAYDRANKTIAENEARFMKEFKAGLITGLKNVDTFVSVAGIATAGKAPFPVTLFFGVAWLITKSSLYILEETAPTKFMSGLAFDTTVDMIAGTDKRFMIANELVVKPYFSWIADQIEKDKKERK